MRNSSISRRDFVKHTALAAGAAGVLATAGARSATAQEHPKLPVAVIIGMLPKELSDREKFELAKRCGLDGIEGYPMDDLDAAKKQADEAREVGIVIHSLTYGGWSALFSDPDEAVVAKGLQAFENALRCAKAMDIDNVLLVPAKVTPQVRYVEAYERSQKNIRKVLPLAEELGVVIAVENVWNDFLLSPLEFARYVDEFESPYVKAYFDVGNIVKYGYPQDWIRTLGSRINRIHLKDYSRKEKDWKPLREGEVDWPEVRKALAEIGYTGFCTAEVAGGGEERMTDLAQRMTLIATGQ
ncbi:MAG: sugar phosphate isomerase/epimerase family protein [Candidatus Hydrogenedentota bacterium]